MITGRKPHPVPAPRATTGLPRCPAHLDATARNEWRRLAKPLYEARILSLTDRAALAAYCQAYSRWVAAETKLAETPMLIKMPSGYIQQSPWLQVSNKQLELMARFMAELGLTPASRARVQGPEAMSLEPVKRMEFVIVSTDDAGNRTERPLNRPNDPPKPYVEHADSDRIALEADL